MIELKNIELSDKQWLDPLMKKTGYFGCENSFGCVYMWKDTYLPRVGLVEGFALIESTYEDMTTYLLPLGEGDAAQAVQTLITEFKRDGKPLCFHGVEPAGREFLENNFPGKFEFNEYREGFDYLYNSADLIMLAGKKFHSKRNHISNFERTYDWSFEEITQANVADCIAMNNEWCKQNDCGGDIQLQREHIAVRRAINNFFELGLKGGMLRADGRVVAYSIGEEINSRVFAVHIEKAFSDVSGAYPTVNREFAKAFCGDYAYINREDDVGVEGLRKAKLSYHPAILLSKSLARYKGE